MDKVPDGVSLRDYFESKLGEVERRLKALNEFHKFISEERSNFVSRELHDRLMEELNELDNKVTALSTKISTWFMIVAGAYGLIQVALSALFYHLFKQ